MMLRCTEDVLTYVEGICFKTGPPGLVGVESEWFVRDPAHPERPVPLARLAAVVPALDSLPAAASVTYEPGGQLELSSFPQPGLHACYSAVAADITRVREHLAGAGLQLTGYGLDPLRPPRRLLDHPRYAAMEAFFDARGPQGRIMMCSTAAIQISVDVGSDATAAAHRWRLAHALGPVLVAAFANSPLRGGRRTGWCSTRQAVWAALDSCHTRAPDGDDPVAAFTRYALDAPVMVMRRDTGNWVSDPGITFRDWLEGNCSVRFGRPTTDDLDYHLTTLFPPVRPRGWFELRMIDAQSPAYWPVPVALVTALLDDPVAADHARQAAEPVAGRWLAAARDGLSDHQLADAARRCFEAALPAVRRLGACPDLLAAVEDFAGRYVARGRCPADDVFDGDAGVRQAAAITEPYDPFETVGKEVLWT